MAAHRPQGQSDPFEGDCNFGKEQGASVVPLRERTQRRRQRCEYQAIHSKEIVGTDKE